MVYPVTQVRLSPEQFASGRWLIRLKKLSLAMEPSFLSLCKTLVFTHISIELLVLALLILDSELRIYLNCSHSSNGLS